MGVPQAAAGEGAAADSMRRALVAVFSRPKYQWTVHRSPLAWLGEAISRFFDWAATFTAAHPGWSDVLLSLLLVVLVALLAHLGWVAWRAYESTVRPAQRPIARATAPVMGDARSHLAQAEALARAGRYTEALAHRFIAVVLQLESARLLAFHPSKTPAEYVTEARVTDEARTSLAALVASLYRHVFGAEPVDEAEYRAFGAAASGVLERVAVG